MSKPIPVEPVKCSVWKSSRKDFTYIYLAHGREFEDLPPELKAAFGEPEYVMDLELTPQRSLANEDVAEVRNNLADVGYHLQLPPADDPTGLLELTNRKETTL